MAKKTDDFNYDADDQELDENGLPIYTDEEDEEDSSTSDLMDSIRKAREGDEDEESDDDSSIENRKKDRKDKQSSNKTEDSNKTLDSKTKESGGRYGDKTPSQKPQDPSKLSKSKQIKTPTEKGGGDNWFSKLTSKFKGEKGGAIKEAGKKAGKEAGKAAAKGAGKAATKAGGKAAAKGGGTVIKGIISGGPYVWAAVIIIILIIIIVCIVVAVVAFLQKKSDPEEMSNNPYVVSSYYYGIRTVYIDESLLLNSLDLSYKQYVVNVLKDIETDNPELNININLPESFDNATLSQHITNMALAIANVAATESDLTNYSGIQLSALYPNIAYFGLTETERNVVTDFILQYLQTNSLIQDKDGNAYTDTIDKSKINDDEKLKYILNRCEKVIIKDEIATGSGLSGIEERQYIASIYMPCGDVQIDGSIYTIASTSEELNVVSKQIEENGGKQTIHKEKETKDNADIIVGFEIGEVFINKFTSIDENNIDAFAEGLSLFDAINKSPDYVNYFTKNEESGLYTWKPTDTSLLYYTYEASTKFIFCDFQLNTQLP